MGFKKILLSATLVLTLLLNVSLNAFASTSVSNNTSVNEFVDKNEFKSLPQTDISELTEDSNLPDILNAKFPLSNIQDGVPLVANGDSKCVLQRGVSQRGITQSYSGTLANQGDFTYYIATLAPKQILNATLVCPKNPDLNYDLLVYDVNSDGSLNNLVAASTTETYFNTYPNGTSKTLDEAASFINNTTTVNRYAVIVFAKKGGSSTDSFELILSLDVDGSYDDAEPNDSPYKAYGVSPGSISGANLHVKNDQDWYIWRATSDIKSAKISVTSDYKVEVYTADGSKVILTNPNADGSVPISNGVNYIRVFTDDATFLPSAYSLLITPWELTPAKMTIELNGDHGENAYPDYPEGSYFRFKDKFCPKITVRSASGHNVANCPVTLYWESGSWNEHTGNKRRTVTGYTNSSGEVTLVLEAPNLPTSLGSHSVYLPGPQQYTHYYDIDGIIISAPGLTPYTNVVYHFSHSVYEGN